MALYAFDGTGQKDDHPELANDGDSNVARFFLAYRPSDVHLPIDDRHNHYQRGVGSEGLFRKALGGITGFGGRTFVRRAIHKLEENIERNDVVIDVVGFSRGAALANATAHMLDNFDPIETMYRQLRQSDVVHESVATRDGCNNPAATCVVVSDTGEPRGTFGVRLA